MTCNRKKNIHLRPDPPGVVSPRNNHVKERKEAKYTGGFSDCAFSTLLVITELKRQDALDRVKTFTTFNPERCRHLDRYQTSL